MAKLAVFLAFVAVVAVAYGDILSGAGLGAGLGRVWGPGLGPRGVWGNRGWGIGGWATPQRIPGWGVWGHTGAGLGGAGLGGAGLGLRGLGIFG